MYKEYPLIKVQVIFHIRIYFSILSAHLGTSFYQILIPFKVLDHIKLKNYFSDFVSHAKQYLQSKGQRDRKEIKAIGLHMADPLSIPTIALVLQSTTRNDI